MEMWILVILVAAQRWLQTFRRNVLPTSCRWLKYYYAMLVTTHRTIWYHNTAQLLSLPWQPMVHHNMHNWLGKYTQVFRVLRQLFQKWLLQAFLPPSESWSSLVSFESLYGTWRAFLDLSPRADITFPKANCNSKVKKCTKSYDKFIINSQCMKNHNWTTGSSLLPWHMGLVISW